MVVFGKTAALERRARPTDLLEMPPTTAENGKRETATIQSVISTERTNVAAALRLSLAAFPPSSRKRIVLISDGNENMEVGATEAEAARRNGVRIDVLPIKYDYPNEVLVEKVVAPAQVSKGASFEVRTVVTAHRPQRATLRLFQNAQTIGDQTVDLNAGRNVFSVKRMLKEPGYYEFTAIVESVEDTLPTNNKASAFTVVRGQGRVLYVESDPDHGHELLRALTEEGLDVKMADLSSLPLTLGQIIPHDTLILSNISASALGPDGMRAIELAVKDWGVGLVVIGGENAYGPGGYQGSPLERALPVEMEIKHRRVIPTGALVVILHTCEIPQGNFWAQQIAMAALRVLSAADEYGILYYGMGGEQWLFKLQPVRDKNAMASAISTCQPGDMPSYIKALQMAHTALKGSKSSTKHTIVISDGDPSYPSDQAVQAMVADGITISTIGISPHSPNDTKRLAYIAAIGKGRYYEPTNPNLLPQIFIKEAATVRRALIQEDRFQPRVALASEIVKGIAPEEYPALRGYVLTTPKQLAEVPLASHQKDPVLAHWQYGLGRTVAFTSDAKSRWAAEWMGWPKYRQFWAQVVRWSARSVEDAGIRTRTEIKDDQARLVIDAVDPQGHFKNSLDIQGILVTPENREVPLVIEQTGPGRYEATFDTPVSGAHYVSLRYADGEGQKPKMVTHGVVVPYSAEYSELTTNEALLKTIATMTDGRVLTAEDDIFSRKGFPPAERYADAWPALLLAAILLLPVDVFVRRVFIDYGKAWRRGVRLFQAYVLRRRRTTKAEAHMNALLSAKKASRETIARRVKKFEPAAPTPEDEAIDVAAAVEGAQPEVKTADAPPVRKDQPSVAKEDDTYMGRLLRAKRHAKPDENRQSAEGHENTESKP